MECDSAQFDCGPTSLDMASGGLERQQLSVAERIQIRREAKNELTALWLCGSVALWLCGSVALWLHSSPATFVRCPGLWSDPCHWW